MLPDLIEFNLCSIVFFHLYALVCFCCCPEILALCQTLQLHTHSRMSMHTHTHIHRGIIMEGGSDL